MVCCHWRYLLCLQKSDKGDLTHPKSDKNKIIWAEGLPRQNNEKVRKKIQSDRLQPRNNGRHVADWQTAQVNPSETLFGGHKTGSETARWLSGYLLSWGVTACIWIIVCDGSPKNRNRLICPVGVLCNSFQSRPIEVEWGKSPGESWLFEVFICNRRPRCCMCYCRCL